MGRPGWPVPSSRLTAAMVDGRSCATGGVLARHSVGETRRARMTSRWWGSVGGAVAFAWFLALALARWNEARATSYDVGIFSQAAQQWSRGNLPSAFIRGPDTLLADHFSPVTVLFGAAWRIWPDPRVLLVVQALCLAVGVGVLVGMAVARLGAWAAALVLITALVGKALVAGDLFDVHEVCFAVPLAALLCWALLERRLGWAAVAGVLLVLVKEDLGLTVGVAGIIWWWRGGRGRGRGFREGLLLGVIGALGLLLAMLVIGHFNPAGHTSYLDYFTGGSGSSLGQHSEPPVHELALSQRVVPLFMLTVAAFVLGWRSSLIWLALPTLTWRMVSSNASYWSSDNHYGLVVWPIAVAAAIDACAVLRRGTDPRLPEQTSATAQPSSSAGWLGGAAVLLAAVAVVVNFGAGVGFIVDRGINPLSVASRSPELASLDRLMATVPPGSRVAAQNHLGPYLIPRYAVTMLGVDRPERVSYVVLVDDQRREFQAQPCERAAYLRSLAHHPDWRVRRDGDLVLVAFPEQQPAGLHGCPAGR